MDNILVVGGGVAGLQASLDLADFGYNVIMLEKEEKLGGSLNKLSKLFPSEQNAADLISNFLKKIKDKKNIQVINNAEILDIEGEFPTFEVKFKSSDSEKNVSVNAIIVSTGFKLFDPSKIKQYGYGRYKDVITSLELEEMLKNKEILQPSNLKKPKSISIIQCVGSRDKKSNTYCSAYCCNYAIRTALQIKEIHPEIMITILYMDIRTPCQGEFNYNKARLSGVRFIRGKPAKVRQIKKEMKDILVVQVEDTLENDLIFLESDIVVLSIGGVSNPTNTFFKEKLNLELSDSGFFRVTESPVGTNVKNVFVAGSASGLKDSIYSINQGSCAAAKVDIALKSIKVNDN